MINRMLCGLAALFGALVMALGLAVGTASAEEAGHYPAAGWDVRQHDGTGWAPAESSRITGPTVVELVKPAGNVGTSIETTNLDLEVQDGDVISVDYELTGDASFEAGAVRMFFYDRPDAVTETVGPTKFTAATAHAGTLSLTVEASGTIGTLGLTYDASNDSAGTVTFSNLKVDGTLVLFTEPVQETESSDPGDTQTPDSDDTQTPDPGDTQTPDPGDTQTPSATESPEAATLPQTSGVRLLPALLIGGFALIGAGAAFYYATRRKMDPTL